MVRVPVQGDGGARSTSGVRASWAHGARHGVAGGIPGLTRLAWGRTSR